MLLLLLFCAPTISLDKGNVVVFTYPNQSNLSERLHGYESVLNGYPGIKVNQAVETGAQYASINPYNGSTWPTNVQSAMTNGTTLTISPTVGAETCGCPNSTNTAIQSHDSVSNCGTLNGSTGTLCTDGSQPGYYVTISAQATYASVMPYSVLGTSATLSSQAVVRVQ